MARGAEAKLRRRANRKKNEGDDPFGTSADDDGAMTNVDEIPLPPGMKQEQVQVETVDSDDEDEAPMPKKKNRAAKAAAAATGKKKEVKQAPLMLLVLILGTTILPGLIYAGDYLSAFLAKNDVLGSIGFRLGIGAVPKKRVISFYEKHAPEKIAEVPTILAKHYGDYPKLIKRLERKYQDYGYFVGWEEDEAALRLAMEQLQVNYQTFVHDYWNRYAPQLLKTYARNARYNLTFLFKRVKKVWKKQIWPILEPFLGVPDEREAKRQKRKDAADARARREATNPSGTKRKNRDYRDDEE